MIVNIELKPSPSGNTVDIPSYATPGSAGLDLRACLDAEVVIPPGGTELIPTGVAFALPEGYAGFVFARSGLGIRHGITPANAVGVIDSDYRGEVRVGLHNHSGNDFTISHRDRIAQLVIMPVAHAELIPSNIGHTARGDGGFGSTGVR